MIIFVVPIAARLPGGSTPQPTLGSTGLGRMLFDEFLDAVRSPARRLALRRTN